MLSESQLLSNKTQEKMLLILGLFTLGSTVFTLIGEALKTRLIWYIRVADFIDLVVVAPLYLVSIVLFHEHFILVNVSRRLRVTFFVISILFLYGHAMHLTANVIDTFSTEIRDYFEILPRDTYDLIYFFDETLSHIIVFITRYSLFAILLIFEAHYQASRDGSSIRWAAAVVGILFGFWEAIVFIEGQKVFLVPFVVVGLGIVLIWLWRKSSVPVSAFLRIGPITIFCLTLLPSILLGLVVYASIVGGFTEPSELAWLGLLGYLPKSILLF